MHRGTQTPCVSPQQAPGYIDKLGGVYTQQKKKNFTRNKLCIHLTWCDWFFIVCACIKGRCQDVSHIYTPFASFRRILLPGRVESVHFSRAVYVKRVAYFLTCLTLLFFIGVLMPRRLVSYTLVVVKCAKSGLRRANTTRVVYQERLTYALWGRDITDDEARLVDECDDDRMGAVHFITLPCDDE